MYRKIAFASLALNVVLSVSLFTFLTWFLDLAKNFKIEMPMLLMWLINILHFLTNPQTIIPTVAILLVGFFALKTFRRRAQNAA